MLVALDTSTKYAGVALYDERGVLAESNWLADGSHTVQLLPTLERLLAALGAEARGLRAVGVALGPGSFTGLRVAVSAAKGLCLALDIPFIGVGTLAATAYQQRLAGVPVCALVDAGRGQLHGTVYEAGEARWPPQGPGGIATLAELLDRVERTTIFCGEVDERAARAIRDNLDGLAIVASPATGTRRAAALAELAWGRYLAGEADDLAAVQPLYLARPGSQPGA